MPGPGAQLLMRQSSTAAAAMSSTKRMAKKRICALGSGLCSFGVPDSRAQALANRRGEYHRPPMANMTTAETAMASRWDSMEAPWMSGSRAVTIYPFRATDVFPRGTWAGRAGHTLRHHRGSAMHSGLKQVFIGPDG